MEIKNLTSQLEWHPTRRWASRQLSNINKIVIHQELGEGSIESVNQYHIKANHISPQGCPHFCYHYGIRKNGEVVQANELSNITWHVKGENSVSIGIMLVGNFKGVGNEVSASEPTTEQIASLNELCEYLLAAFKLSNQDLYGHYHFGKPVCPGFTVQAWIEDKRNTITDIPQINTIEKTTAEIQKRLNQLGYEAGPVDGIKGIKTINAIRKFQYDNKLMVDGVVGPQTWKAIIKLTSNNSLKHGN